MQIGEFLANSEILGFHNGNLFIKNLKKLRVYNLDTAQWFICSHNKSIINVANNFFFFGNNAIRAFPLSHPSIKDALIPVPAWVTDSLKYYTLSDGTRLKVLMSHKRIELHDVNGIRFAYEKHQVSLLDYEGKQYIKETDIILSFKIQKDSFILQVVDKLSLKKNWVEGVTGTNGTYWMNNTRDSILPETQNSSKGNYRESYEMENHIDLKFDLNGSELKNEKPYTYNFLDLEDPKGPDLFQKESLEIGTVNVRNIPYHLSNGHYQAFWTKERIILCDNSIHKVYFTLDSKYGKSDGRLDLIQNVFLDEEEVILLRFDTHVDSEESGNQYCSGTCYDKYIETRLNYRLEFYSFEGALKKTISLPFQEEHNHMGYTPKFPKMVAANRSRALIKNCSRSGFILNEFLDEKNIELPEILDHNNQFVVRTYITLNLKTGKETGYWPEACKIVALSGHYLAIAEKKKITILDLENNSTQVTLECEKRPIKFLRFNLENSPQDFIAVQCKKCILVWHKCEQASNI